MPLSSRLAESSTIDYFQFVIVLSLDMGFVLILPLFSPICDLPTRGCPGIKGLEISYRSSSWIVNCLPSLSVESSMLFRAAWLLYEGFRFLSSKLSRRRVDTEFFFLIT